MDVQFIATWQILMMKNKSSIQLIEESNLSVAWARAFLQVANSPTKHCEPLIVTIRPDDKTTEIELLPIRRLLDDALKSGGKSSCDTVAGTIFPKSLWNSEKDRSLLYNRYSECWSQIKKCKGNGKGTYFRRMTAFRSDDSEIPVNQLEHIIEGWNKNVRRNSAFQLAIFDPSKDHTYAKYLGFPCLHQIALTPLGNPRGTDGLGITGFYATQYLFQKAYGNYLGLLRLGEFVAHETGLSLSSITCIATDGQIGDIPKVPKFLSQFKKQLGDCLNKLGVSDD